MVVTDTLDLSFKKGLESTKVNRGSSEYVGVTGRKTRNVSISVRTGFRKLEGLEGQERRTLREGRRGRY